MPRPKIATHSTPSVSATATATPPAAGLGSSSGAIHTTAATPAFVLNAPPTVTVPAPPAGFTPVNLLEYRGYHPKAGQLAAAPDVVLELQSFPTYETVFLGMAPPATQLAGEIDSADKWTQLRIAVETLLVYAKSGEAVAWKAALVDTEKLDQVARLVTAKNPNALAAYPALVRMLAAPKVIAKTATATRARKAKAKKTDATTPTTTSTAAAGPAATPATPGK